LLITPSTQHKEQQSGRKSIVIPRNGRCDHNMLQTTSLGYLDSLVQEVKKNVIKSAK
jgi:hypothetical protein